MEESPAAVKKARAQHIMEKTPEPGSRLMGQYWEIEQPDGSVIEMHVMRLLGPSEKIPLVVRTKAAPWTDGRDI